MNAIKWSVPRFGAYSLETYQRRNKQKMTKLLIGHKPGDVFDRMKRNLSEHHNNWGTMLMSDQFLALLERAIFNADKASLIEIDQKFEAFEGVVPEQYAQMVEYRALELEQAQWELQLQHAQRYSISASINEAKDALSQVKREKESLTCRPPSPQK